MSRKYDIYDKRGNKIGQAREQPTGAEQIVGGLILLWLVWELLKGIIALVELTIEFLIGHPKFALVVISVAVIGGLYLGIYVPSHEQAKLQISLTATANEYQNHLARVAAGLSFLKQYRGMFEVNRSTTDDGRNVQVNFIEFSPEGIKVYFNVKTLRDSPPEDSCIVWQGSKVSNAEEWDFPYDGWPIHEGWSMRSVSQQLTVNEIVESNGMWDVIWEQYSGYVIFPYSILPTSADALGANSIYYFHFSCNAFHRPILLFDVADFGR